LDLVRFFFFSFFLRFFLRSDASDPDELDELEPDQIALFKPNNHPT
jgi:hypothetical protein